jgi:hypothetical protein
MKRIETNSLIIDLEPELGGKITQVTSRRSGRQWLTRHPRLEWRQLSADELALPNAYTLLGDLGGWDECCPTVGYSTNPLSLDQFVTDHGECWSQLPEVSITDRVFECRWAGQIWPFELTRKMTVDETQPRFQVKYTLRSKIDRPIPILWSQHPLFSIEVGMRIEIAAGIEMLIASDRSPFGAQGDRFKWPHAGSLDTSIVTPRAGRSTKLFSDVMSPGSIALIAANGDRFQMSWSSEEHLPIRLGLWMNYGDWAGDSGAPLNNLGIEPSLGYPDRLDEATENGTAFVLQPDRSYRWQIEIEIY